MRSRPRKFSACRRLRDVTAEMLERAKGKMDEVVFRRARHVISEIERTVHAAEGIRASNWPTVGQLMYASHYSLRDDYEVSCKELDVVVEIAEGIGFKGGVYGCRMTGGGFGGCAVALVKAELVEGHLAKDRRRLQKEDQNRGDHFCLAPGGGRDGDQGLIFFRPADRSGIFHAGRRFGWFNLRVSV